MGKSWTLEDVAVLKKRLGEKYTVSDIAHELDRTVLSVQTYITKKRLGNGRTGKPRNLDRLAKIISYIGSGLSGRDIAKQLGCGRTPVYRTLRSLVKDHIVVKTGVTNNSKYRLTKKWGRYD